jgi:hypothetical protein
LVKNWQKVASFITKVFPKAASSNLNGFLKATGTCIAVNFINSSFGKPVYLATIVAFINPFVMGLKAFTIIDIIISFFIEGVEKYFFK